MHKGPTRRLVVMAALAAGGVLVAWMIWQRDALDDKTTGAAAGNVSIAATLTELWPAGAVSDPLVSEPPLRAGEFNVCGVGRTKLENFELPQQLSVPAYAAFARWADREANDPQERMRARGLFFRISLASSQEHLLWDATHGNACSGECARSRDLAVERQTAADRQALARLAVTTREPAVYALALSACRGRGGECQQLSDERWAQLEPDNAAPWLFIATHAEQRKDNAKRDDALRRAASADRLDWHHRGLHEGALRMGDAAGSGAGKSIALMHGIGLWSAQWLPIEGVALGCSADALKQDHRIAPCEQLASLLVGDRNAERSSLTLVDIGVGKRIGESVGWAPARIAALKLEADAINAVSIAMVDTHPLYSCAWVDAIQTLTADRISLGELGAARAALTASGRSNDEWAKSWRAKAVEQAAQLKARAVTEPEPQSQPKPPVSQNKQASRE